MVIPTTNAPLSRGLGGLAGRDRELISVRKSSGFLLPTRSKKAAAGAFAQPRRR